MELFKPNSRIFFKDNNCTLMYFHYLSFKNPETGQLSKYTVRGKMLSRALGILHNLSKRVPTRRSYAACQAIDVLIPLLKAEVTLFSAKSLLVLAYLTDEENNHLIMADEGNIYTVVFYAD